MIHSRHSLHGFLGLALRHGTIGSSRIRRSANSQATADAWGLVVGCRVTPTQHADGLLHDRPYLHPLPDSRHRADVRSHLVHHVVRKMAVEHPVAYATGDKLDVARLRYAYQRRISSRP